MRTTTKILGLSVALLFAGSAGAAYRCVDDKGKTHVGDTPPEQCGNVVMYEVTRSGSVIRKIDPSLTPEQVKERADAEEKRKEGEKIAAEAKRKDLALLATYSSEGEFDVVRDRSIEPIKGRIKSAQERLAAIDKRTKEIDDEMEFYKAGKKASAKKAEAPPNLVSELDRLKSEKAGLVRGIAASEKEIKDMHAKFDVDKKRWVALKTGGGAAPIDPKPGEPKAMEAAKAEAKPVKGDAKAAKK